MNTRIKRLLDDYKDQRPLFEEFNVAVFNLLQNMLESKNYKCQTMYRTKSLESLKEKLIRKEKAGKIHKSLDDVKDLVGVRIIFYFEGDRDRFIKELNDEISGQFILDKKHKPSGYSAKHIVLSFGPKRLVLNEYKKFDKLKCEVQLTSILHHAWSEIEHDLVYKNRDLGQKKYQKIKSHLNKILKSYILKAISEIDEVSKIANE